MSSRADEMLHSLVVVAPVGRDAHLICEFLSSLDVKRRPYARVRDVPQEILESVSVLLIAEEALDAHTIQHLSTTLRNQPTWSDIPILVLTGSGPAPI